MSQFAHRIAFRGACWLALVMCTGNSATWGAGCAPEFCAQLLTVPRTGAVFIDARSEPAPVWAFTLQALAAGPSLRPEHFTSPFGNGVSEDVASTTFIGDFDPDEVGKKFLSLGTIVQPFRSGYDVVPYFSTASYATTADDAERSFLVGIVIPGDFERDMDVDSANLLTILENWTGALTEPSATVDYHNGDVDFDFDVDSADLLAFLENWTGATSMAPLPEPALGSAAFLLGLWAVGTRRRSSGAMG